MSAELLSTPRMAARGIRVTEALVILAQYPRLSPTYRLRVLTLAAQGSCGVAQLARMSGFSVASTTRAYRLLAERHIGVVRKPNGAFAPMSYSQWLAASRECKVCSWL